MSKRLRSKRRSSTCIFQVVVLLSIRSFPPQFLVVFNSISVVKSIKFSTRNSKYFVYSLPQLPSMRRTHVGNPTWINSISPELCPPSTCERACSGNEIGVTLLMMPHAYPPKSKMAESSLICDFSVQISHWEIIKLRTIGKRD
jgi:hypothetical protein